jgi:hypothetical protein
MIGNEINKSVNYDNKLIMNLKRLIGLSNDDTNIIERYKAEFFPKVNQIVNQQLKKLYEIRKNRLITNEDLLEYPNWKNDGNGFW